MKAWLRIGPSWMAALAAILVPIVLAIVGANINRTIAETQVSADYVRLSVEILSAEPGSDEESDADRALRDWAVDVLEARSPVELDSTLIEALRQGDIVLSVPTFSASLSPFTFPQDGDLPEGCVVTTNRPVLVFSEALSESAAVGHVNPGSYDALEIRSGQTQSFQIQPFYFGEAVAAVERLVRLEQGWVRLTFDTYLDDATCQP